MLVLSRQVNERIVINGNIIVTVVGVRSKDGNVRVRLGIEAPKEITIDREEIHDGKVKGREVAVV